MGSCLVCTRSGVEAVLDLGLTALANKFLTTEELARPEPHFPLRLGFCRDCSHVQLLDIVPANAMFEDYLYVSAASDTLKAHLFDLSDIIARRCSLGPADLVVDVGCNDGTLLSGFRRYKTRTLGVDPAQNIAALAKNSDIPRCVAFFDSTSAIRIMKEWGRASVVTVTNTFPHIQDLQDFLRAVDILLAPGGVLAIESHYLMDILSNNAFDTIYHEHVSYWSLTAMAHLFGKAGMRILSAERLPLHHGQLRVFVVREGEGKVDSSVQTVLTEERDAGLGRIATFHAFRDRTMSIKSNLRSTLRSLRREGKRVVGYGAPAKGSTLLEFLEIDSGLIEYIVDRSPLKQGRYTPGTHIPIVSTERLIEDQPEYVLLLAWNFLDEILEQQREYRRRGGKFIIPLPTTRVVE